MGEVPCQCEHVIKNICFFFFFPFFLDLRARATAPEMWIHAWSFCYNSLAATVKRVCLVKSVIIHKFIPRIACVDLNELSLRLTQTEQLLTGVRQGWHTLCSRCYLCCLQMYYRICPWHGQRSLGLDCSNNGSLSPAAEVGCYLTVLF